MTFAVDNSQNGMFVLFWTGVDTGTTSYTEVMVDYRMKGYWFLKTILKGLSFYFTVFDRTRLLS